MTFPHLAERREKEGTLQSYQVTELHVEVPRHYSCVLGAALKKKVCLSPSTRVTPVREPIRMDVKANSTTKNGDKHMKATDKYVGLDVHQDTTVDRKSTRLNSSHLGISYAVFC